MIFSLDLLLQLTHRLTYMSQYVLEQANVPCLHSVRIISHRHRQVCLVPILVSARETIVLVSVEKLAQGVLTSVPVIEHIT